MPFKPCTQRASQFVPARQNQGGRREADMMSVGRMDYAHQKSSSSQDATLLLRALPVGTISPPSTRDNELKFRPVLEPGLRTSLASGDPKPAVRPGDSPLRGDCPGDEEVELDAQMLFELTRGEGSEKDLLLESIGAPCPIAC